MTEINPLFLQGSPPSNIVEAGSSEKIDAIHIDGGTYTVADLTVSGNLDGAQARL